jgi:hypothetical protein
MSARRASPPKGIGFGEAMSSSHWDKLRNGDEDVATPAMDLEQGGDVLIAVGGALGMGDEDVASPALRRQGKDAPNSTSLPSPSSCPINNMPGRHGEECRGARSATLVARVGIGIGIGIGIENEAEHAVRTRTRSRSRSRSRSRLGCAFGAKGSHANRGISVAPAGAFSSSDGTQRSSAGLLSVGPPGLWPWRPNIGSVGLVNGLLTWTILASALWNETFLTTSQSRDFPRPSCWSPVVRKPCRVPLVGSGRAADEQSGSISKKG